MNSSAGERGGDSAWPRFSVALVMCAVMFPVLGNEPAPRQLGVLDAVALTLEKQPSIRLSRIDADAAGAAVMQAAGAFDPVFTASGSFEYRPDPLTRTTLQAEQERRDTIQEVIDESQLSIDDRLSTIENIEEVLRNPEGAELTDEVSQRQADVLAALLLDQDDPESRQRILDATTDFLEQRIDDLESEIEQFQATRERETERLTLLGPLPEQDQDYNASINLGLSKPFRNGLNLSGFYDLSMFGSKFKDKPREPERGGKGRDDIYTTKVGIRLDIPLGDGGPASADAALESAEALQSAAGANLRHAVATAIFRTVIAYWDVAAAARSLQIFTDAESLQRRMRLAVQGLIDGDLLAPVEINRIEGRLATTQAQRQGAAAALEAARLTLIDAMGESPDLNIATRDALPDALAGDLLGRVDRARLGEALIERRADIAAARRGLESALPLLRAARADRGGSYDLGLSVFGTGIGAGTSRTYEDALDDAALPEYAGPGGAVDLAINVPLINRFDRGSLQLAELDVDRRRVLVDESIRQARIGALLRLDTLDDLIAQMESSYASAEALRKALEGENERVKAGESTVLSLIFAEERLTSALLQFNAAHASYAKTLAALRYEAGLWHPEEVATSLGPDDIQSLAGVPLTP